MPWASQHFCTTEAEMGLAALSPEENQYRPSLRIPTWPYGQDPGMASGQHLPKAWLGARARGSWKGCQGD